MGCRLRCLTTILIVGTALATTAIACPTGVTIIDGDTIAIDGEHVRLVGLDAPEIERARCAEERERGAAAMARIEELICRSGEVSLRVVRARRLAPAPHADRYGRALARVTVDGLDVADLMITEGLARPRRPRRGWCAVMHTGGT